MKTETLTETPRTDAAIVHAWECKYAAKVVHSDIAGELERELAAVTKERDEALRTSRNDRYILATVQTLRMDLITELRASQARELALRPFVEEYKASLETMLEDCYLPGQSKRVEEAIKDVSAALATPPPPLVLKEDAEALANCLAEQRTNLASAGLIYKNSELAADARRAQKVLDTYRAKHPAATIDSP